MLTRRETELMRQIFDRLMPLKIVCLALPITLAACEEQNTYVEPPPPKVTVAQPVVQEVTDFLEVTGTIVASADIYVSNFGELKVVPSRHIRESSNIDRNVFVIDPEYAKIAYFRPWQQYDLAKTGDNIRRTMLVEWALEVCNEAAHGIVADLDNS